MGQTADEIRGEIDAQREQLGANLAQLEEKVRTTVDWRAQFEQHPLPALGIAFATGFALSALMPSGDRDGSRSRDGGRQDLSNYRVFDEATAWAQGQRSGPQQAQPIQAAYQQPEPQPARQRSPELGEIAETIDTVRGAIMGLAANRLRSFLAEAIPGFDEEYEQARRSRGASEATRLTSTDGKRHDTTWQRPTGATDATTRTPLGEAAADRVSDPVPAFSSSAIDRS